MESASCENLGKFKFTCIPWSRSLAFVSAARVCQQEKNHDTRLLPGYLLCNIVVLNSGAGGKGEAGPPWRVLPFSRRSPA